MTSSAGIGCLPDAFTVCHRSATMDATPVAKPPQSMSRNSAKWKECCEGRSHEVAISTGNARRLDAVTGPVESRGNDHAHLRAERDERGGECAGGAPRRLRHVQPRQRRWRESGAGSPVAANHRRHRNAHVQVGRAEFRHFMKEHIHPRFGF